MKRFTEILSGCAAVLFQLALTGWMFALSEINFDFEIMRLNYLLLSGVMLAAYFINMAIMRRGVPVPVFAIIEILMVAAGAFAFVKSVYLEPFVLRTVIINCIIFCLGFAVAAYLAWTPTNQNGVLLRFDALAIMSLVLIVLDEILGLHAASDALLMCWICLGLMLLSAISLKSGALAGRGSAVEGNGAMGRIMLFVVFGIIGVLALLLIVYAASGFKSFSEFMLDIISTVVAAVKTVLVFLYGLLERFVRWLSQFAKDVPMEPIGAEPVMGMEIPPGEETMAPLPGWIYYILAGIAAAILVYIIFRLRKFRTVKVQSRAVSATKVQRESGLWKAFRELWEKLCTELRFRYNSLRYRRSAAGLLVWCEKKADESMARQAGESGEKFLLRLGKTLGGESGDNLAKLADIVERSFYSPLPAEVPAQLYKAVKKTKFKVEKTEE